MVPGLALAQALGWLGAAAHGAGAGIALPLAWRWAPHMRDLYGVVVPRFPLQYLAAALSLLTWALLTWAVRRDSARVACYLLLTGWGLVPLGWGLERRVPVLAGLTAEQVACLALGLAGLAILHRQATSDAQAQVRRFPSGQASPCGKSEAASELGGRAP